VSKWYLVLKLPECRDCGNFVFKSSCKSCKRCAVGFKALDKGLSEEHNWTRMTRRTINIIYIEHIIERNINLEEIKKC
jgi:hypothetical protein